MEIKTIFTLYFMMVALAFGSVLTFENAEALEWWEYDETITDIVIPFTDIVIVQSSSATHGGSHNSTPVIIILGSNPVNLNQDDPYTDAGATASDVEDGDLTSSIITINNVDTSIIGATGVTYEVTDSNSNFVSVTRVVNVGVPPEPVPDPEPTGYINGQPTPELLRSWWVGNNTALYTIQPDEPDNNPDPPTELTFSPDYRGDKYIEHNYYNGTSDWTSGGANADSIMIDSGATDELNRPIFVQYLLDEQQNWVTLETGSLSWTFDIPTCSFKIYNSGKITGNDPIIESSTVLLQEYIDDEWVNSSHNLETCDVTVNELGDGSLQLIAKQGFGGTDYKEIELLHKGDILETFYRSPQASFTGQQYGFVESHIKTQTVQHWNQGTNGLQNYGLEVSSDIVKGKSEFMSGGLDVPILMSNANGEVSYNPKDSIHNALTDVTITKYASDKLQTFYDYHNTTPLNIGEVLEIDPTFVSDTVVDDRSIRDGTDNDLCDQSGTGAGPYDFDGSIQTLLQILSDDPWDCWLGLFGWSISSLGSDIDVTNISIKVEMTTSVGGRICDVKWIEDDYVSAGTTFADILSGTVYLNNHNFCTSTGSKTFTLSETAESDFEGELTGDDQFTLGYTFDDLTMHVSNYYNAYIGPRSDDDPPEITVTYTNPTVPAQVTGLTTTAQSTSAIDLSWTIPDDGGSAITGYKIEITTHTSACTGGSWGTEQASHGTNSYSDTSLTINTCYSYRVSAINSVGTGAVSSASSEPTISGVPTSVSATGSSTTQIDLTYTVPSGPATITGYKIEILDHNSICTGDASWATEQASHGSTTYNDSSLTTNICKEYRVSAINDGGTSATSSTTTGTTLPTAIADLTGTGDSPKSVTLTWSELGTGTTGHKVERESPTGGGFSTIVADTGIGYPTASYTDTTLAQDTQYNYKVSVINDDGTSGTSNEFSATTPVGMDRIFLTFGDSFQEDIPSYNFTISQDVQAGGVTMWKDNSPEPFSVTTRPLSYVTFDSLDANAIDYGSRDGTITASGTTTHSPSPLGNSRIFDGTNDLLTYSNESDFDFEYTDTYSVSFWYKIPSTGGAQILSKGATYGGGDGWALDYQTGFNGFVFIQEQVSSTNNNLWTMVSTGGTHDNEWHHFVFAYDGSNAISGLTAYIDGTVVDSYGDVASLIDGTILNSDALFVGENYLNANDFDGTLDDIRIYDVELTTTEMIDLYQHGADRYDTRYTYPDESTLAGTANLLVNLQLDNDLFDHSFSGNDLDAGVGTVSFVAQTNHGRSLSFDEATNYIFPDESVFDFTHNDPFSVCAGADNNDTTPNNIIVSKRNTAALDGFAITHVGEYRFQIWDGAEKFVQGATDHDDENYHYVCGTFSGNANQNGLKIYVDGILDGTGTSSAMTDFSNAQPLKVGSSANNALYWDGTIGDLRIYDKELTITEIWALGNATSPEADIMKTDALISSPFSYAYNATGVDYFGLSPSANVIYTAPASDDIDAQNASTALTESLVVDIDINEPSTSYGTPQGYYVTRQESGVYRETPWNVPMPIAHWKLDGKESGMNNYGSDTLFPLEHHADYPSKAKFTNGMISKAIQFDNDNFLQTNINNESNFDFEHTDPFSISTWVQYTGTANMGIVTKLTNLAATTTGFYLRAISGNIQFALNESTPTGNNISTPLTYNDGEWHNVVATYDGSSNKNGMQLYVDGISVVTGASNTLVATILNDEKITIGGDSAGTELITGKIDDVRIWDSEISASNVLALYQNSTMSIKSNPYVNEIAHYKFDRNLYDSANGYNLKKIVGNVEFNSTGINENILFDGSTYYRVEDSSAFNFERTDSFSVTGWVNMQSTCGCNQKIIDHTITGGNSQGWHMQISNAFQLHAKLIGNGATTSLQMNTSGFTKYDSYSTNDWVMFAVTYDGSSDSSGLKFYRNNLEMATDIVVDTLADSISIPQKPVTIGADNVGGQIMNNNSQLDDLRIFDIELSAGQIDALWNGGLGSGDPLGTIPSTETRKEIAHLDFDRNTINWADGSDAVIITGTENYTPAILESGMIFDGTTDIIALTNPQKYSFTDGTSDTPFSIAYWYNGAYASGERFINKCVDNTVQEWEIVGTGTDQVRLLLKTDNANYIRINTNTMTADVWNHHVFTYNGDETREGITAYVNGSEDTQLASDVGTYTGMVASVGPVEIGGETCGTTAEHVGQLDDFRIYNYNITSAEVSEIYNSGLGTPEPLGDIASRTVINPSEILHMDFENSVEDNAGNSVTITGSENYVTGKVQLNAYDFDGSTDYLTIGNEELFDIDILDRWSIAYWINADSSNVSSGIVIAKTPSGTNGWGITFNSGGTNFYADGDISGIWDLRSTTAINDNTWHHVIINNDGSGLPANLDIYVDGIQTSVTQFTTSLTGTILNNNAVTIGDLWNGKYEGYLDDIRMFSTNLTSAQITELYNSTVGTHLPLGMNTTASASFSFEQPIQEVAHYKFEDNVIGYYSGAELTVTGTENYVTGKIGQGYDFDGSTDVLVDDSEAVFDFDNTDAFSISTWIDTDTDGSENVFIGKRVAGASADGYSLIKISTNEIWFHLNDGTNGHEAVSSSTHLASEGIIHVVGTYSGNSNQNGIKLYIDGSLDATGDADLITSILNNDKLTMGGYSGTTGNYDGLLDDARIYDFELSSSQVTELYNGGSGTHAPLGWDVHQFKDSDVTGGVEENYRVYQVDASGQSEFTTNISGTPDTPPDPPTSLLVENQGAHDRLYLSWVAPIDLGSNPPITGYKIERETPLGGGFTTLVETTGSTALIYQDMTTSSDTQYNYQIYAITTITSVASNQAFNYTLVTPISDLAGTFDPLEHIDLTWSTVDSPLEYGIFRTCNDGLGLGWVELVNNTGSTSTTYEDSALCDASLHTYNITAWNLGGESDWSNVEIVSTITAVAGTITINLPTHIIGDVFEVNVTAVMDLVFPNATSIDRIFVSGVDGIPLNPTSIALLNNNSYNQPHRLWAHFDGSDTLKISLEVTNGTGSTEFINSTGVASTVEYEPTYLPAVEGSDFVNYTHARNSAGNVIDLKINRLDIDPVWQIECNYRNELFGDGVWVNLTQLGAWEVNQTASPTANSYIQCYNDSLLFTTVSFGSTNATLSLVAFTDQLGSFFGVPLPFLFVIFLAAIFTGRSAPTGIVFIVATIGTMGLMGYFPDPVTGNNMITASVWGMLIIITALGIFMGKRFF